MSPFLIRLPLLVQAVDDAVERCSDVGKVHFGLRQIRLGLGPCQFGLEQLHLLLRDHLAFGSANIWVYSTPVSRVSLGLFGVHLAL